MLPTSAVPAGTFLWRVHQRVHEPVWFGPAPHGAPRNRFDAPDGEFRVCYLGDSREVAAAETLIRQPRLRLVRREQLDERRVSRVPVTRGLTLAQVHGPGLARLGIDAGVAHADPYVTCQLLALEIWSDAAGVDGIEYRSRWDNDRLCYALFDRAADALGAPDQRLNLADPGVWSPIFRLYDVGLVS
jgi:hypothetical protein